MSRVVKFEFLYRGMAYSSENKEFPWLKKHYTLSQLIEKSLPELSDVHGFSELVAKRQFTGLADKNGAEIYEGDIVTDGENFGEVKFFTDGIASCGCCITSFSGSGFAAYTQDECDGFSLEKCLVAGNIYQHPELLK
jgi:hypothetical protein